MTPLLKHMSTICRLLLPELQDLRARPSEIEKARILFLLEDMKTDIRPSLDASYSEDQAQPELRKETFDFAMKELDDCYVQEVVRKKGIDLDSETAARSNNFLELRGDNSARREFELQTRRPIKKVAAT